MAWLAYSVLDGLRSSEAAARQVAGRDALSGLPNRFLFNALVDAEIARCKRGRHQFALFYLDLDISSKPTTLLATMSATV